MLWNPVLIFFGALLSDTLAHPLQKRDSSSPANNTVSGDLKSQLFPLPNIISSWTTSASLKSPLPLSDDTFRLTKLITSLSHTYMPAPDGEISMRAVYPKGSYTYMHQPMGGLSFYAPGPSSVDLSTAREATFGYSVYFPEGFQFNLGGKLPGLYGGDNDTVALSCSGGRRSTDCFSARLMWRTDGAGELYTYLPQSDANTQNLCTAPPKSICNDVYGASVGRGSFKFIPGQRTTISQRVKLNDAGESNGELELFVAGKSVVNVTGLIYREVDEGRIRGIQMQTFFGGSNETYASPQDQDSFFSDFSVAITQSL